MGRGTAPPRNEGAALLKRGGLYVLDSHRAQYVSCGSIACRAYLISTLQCDWMDVGCKEERRSATAVVDDEDAEGEHHQSSSIINLNSDVRHRAPCLVEDDKSIRRCITVRSLDRRGLISIYYDFILISIHDLHLLIPEHTICE